MVIVTVVLIIARVGEVSGISGSHTGTAALLKSQERGACEEETVETKGPGAPAQQSGEDCTEHTSTA